MQIKNIKLTMHNNFYTSEVISFIISKIENSFDIFSIEYIPLEKRITFKLKKTNMKKIDPNYSHESLYYYNIFNNILSETIDIYGNGIISKEDISDISILYNVVTQSDNIVNLLL